MVELLTPSHLMIVAVIAFVLFGGRQLPEPASRTSDCGQSTGAESLTEWQPKSDSRTSSKAMAP